MLKRTVFTSGRTRQQIQNERGNIILGCSLMAFSLNLAYERCLETGMNILFLNCQSCENKLLSKKCQGFLCFCFVSGVCCFLMITIITATLYILRSKITFLCCKNVYFLTHEWQWEQYFSTDCLMHIFGGGNHMNQPTYITTFRLLSCCYIIVAATFSNTFSLLQRSCKKKMSNVCIFWFTMNLLIITGQVIQVDLSLVFKYTDYIFTGYSNMLFASHSVSVSKNSSVFSSTDKFVAQKNLKCWVKTWVKTTEPLSVHSAESTISCQQLPHPQIWNFLKQDTVFQTSI